MISYLLGSWADQQIGICGGDKVRIFALELDNDIKGITERKTYIEMLVEKLDAPDFVILPELAICGYMASRDIWQYADDCGKDTLKWGIMIAQKHDTYIGIGYIDKDHNDYYNRYMIVGKNGLCGIVTKSEGESAVFKRGDFGNIICTPFGNVAVAICYDAKRKHFYNNIKSEEISLIIFPHGCPADPKKSDKEMKNNDFFCETYEKSFGVPVIYVNSKGSLAYMPGKMGRMMAKAGFAMNGRTKIYCKTGTVLEKYIPEAYGIDASLFPKTMKNDIHFHGQDIIRGNWLFRKLILEPDTKHGILEYEKNKIPFSSE